jgi:hypothetical protein
MINKKNFRRGAQLSPYHFGCGAPHAGEGQQGQGGQGLKNKFFVLVGHKIKILIINIS